MKRHRLDLVSLFFGLLFIGLTITAVFGDEDISALEARWVWPVLLVVAGLAIVGFSISTGRRNRESGDATKDSPPVDPLVDR